MSIKLDSKQQEQMIQDLKAREVSEELLDTVAGGIIKDLSGVKYPFTTLAIGEESGIWLINPGV